MEIFQAIAVLIACATAIYGIDAWRREHLGKRRIDLAEETLALFYEARDVIDAVLSPLGYVGEESALPQRQRDPDEHPLETKALDMAYVSIGRYQVRRELFARIRSLRYRFMAQNGRDAGKPFEDLRSIRGDIFKPFRKLVLLVVHERKCRRKGSDDKEYKSKLQSMWEEVERETDPEQVIKQMDEIVERMEGTCRDIIGSNESRFRSLWRAIGNRPG